jgi:spermidine synthase
VLDSDSVISECRELRCEVGCMTVKRVGRSSRYAKWLEMIGAAFGPDCLWAFKPTREGNTIVLALRTPQQPNRAALAERAETIETRWNLPARKWLRVFKPVA